MVQTRVSLLVTSLTYLIGHCFIRQLMDLNLTVTFVFLWATKWMLRTTVSDRVIGIHTYIHTCMYLG